VCTEEEDHDEEEGTTTSNSKKLLQSKSFYISSDSTSLHGKEENRVKNKVISRQSTNPGGPTKPKHVKKKKKLGKTCRAVHLHHENESLKRNQVATNAMIHRGATIDSIYSTARQNDATNSTTANHNNNGPMIHSLSNGTIFINSNGRSMQSS
jgi:hypothetical protein